jgi:hypothetical protein
MGWYSGIDEVFEVVMSQWKRCASRQWCVSIVVGLQWLDTCSALERNRVDCVMQAQGTGMRKDYKAAASHLH